MSSSITILELQLAPLNLCHFGASKSSKFDVVLVFVDFIHQQSCICIDIDIICINEQCLSVIACQTLLGDIPPGKYIKGKMIYLTWLRQNFQQLSVDVDDVVIAQHARAHIMMLIGGYLTSNT